MVGDATARTYLIGSSSFDREISAELVKRGGGVITWPEALVQALTNPEALNDVIENLFGYDWVIFKNEFAAEYFLQAFTSRRETADLDHVRILTIGEATEERVAASSLHVDLAFERLAFANVFPTLESYAGGRSSLASLNFLVPSAKVGRESFEAEFEDAGARVDAVAAYRTVADNKSVAQINALLIGGALDGVIFTKSSSLVDLARVLDTDDLARVLRGVYVVCADAQTKDTAAQFGLLDAAVPPEATISALLDMTR